MTIQNSLILNQTSSTFQLKTFNWRCRGQQLAPSPWQASSHTIMDPTCPPASHRHQSPESLGGSSRLLGWTSRVPPPSCSLAVLRLCQAAEQGESAELHALRLGIGLHPGGVPRDRVGQRSAGAPYLLTGHLLLGLLLCQGLLLLHRPGQPLLLQGRTTKESQGWLGGASLAGAQLWWQHHHHRG